MSSIISSYFAQFMHKRNVKIEDEAEAGPTLQRTGVPDSTIFSNLRHFFGNSVQSGTNVLSTVTNRQSAMALSPGEFDEDELEWEEWDGQGKFWHHMVAGSTAGIVEHVFMYPVDTFKTHLQALSAKEAGQGTLTFSSLLKRHGFLRLWRGAPAVLVGCIPSHAAYFSAYELGKKRFGLGQEGHQPLAAAATGAFATILHDGILTPMDMVKQRLQLGYYRGVYDCLRSIVKSEGLHYLWRSLPTTLVMNIPYAAAVVSANESMKQVTIPIFGPDNMIAYLTSGALAGAFAAAVTCPLDVIKTRLQTEALLRVPPPVCDGRPAGTCAIPTNTQYTTQGNQSQYFKAVKVAKDIWRREGSRGFFRGIQARMAAHTPSQAISWATYELIKSLLIRERNNTPSID